MQDTRYHIITTLSTLFLGYMFAISINQVTRFILTPAENTTISSARTTRTAAPRKEYLSYEENIEKFNFFPPPPPDVPEEEGAVSPVQSAELSSLTLTGTITGPASIARAYIKKRGEREGKLFKLYSDVYGYKLIKVSNFVVKLKKGNNVLDLEMYKEEKTPGRFPPSSRPKGQSTSNTQRGTLSRAEIMQKLKGKGMDEMLKGLRVGPYRVKGKIEGFKLFKVQPSNILYRLGARSGDIIKRINGQPATNSAALFKMWQSLPKETQAIIHLQRGSRLIELNYTISD